MTADIQKCPACGSPLALHMPENETDYESWSFECQAEIYLDERGFAVSETCTKALANGIKRLNEERAAAKAA